MRFQLAVVFIFVTSEVLAAPLNYQDVKEISRDAIRNESVCFEPPEIKTENGQMFYSTGWVGWQADSDLDIAPADKAINTVIMTQLHIELTRFACDQAIHDYPTLNAQFWDPVLVRCEQVVKEQLTVISCHRLTGNALQQQLDRLQSDAQQVRIDAIKRYAESKGLSFSYGTAAGVVAVQLLTSVKGAEIRAIDLLEWFKLSRMRIDPRSKMESVASDGIALSGRYVIALAANGAFITKPTQVNVQSDGTYTFNADGTFTFVGAKSNAAELEHAPEPPRAPTR